MAYTISTIGKVALGTNIQSQSMKFQTDGPLDDRSALKVPASLISQDALGHVNYVYPAMTCSIQSTGDVYILKDKSKLVAQGLKTLEFLNSKTDEEIATNLGMDSDEVLRLKQISGLKEAFIDKEFSKSWEEFEHKHFDEEGNYIEEE